MQNGYGQSDMQATQRALTPREIEGLGAWLSVPKQPAPMMDVSMRTLAQNIERLTIATQNLQSKLEPVLYPEPPQPSTTQAVEARAPRASSNLGAAVNGLADQIEFLIDRVNSITRRCEL